MRFLYTLSIWFLGAGIRFAALFNRKAVLWVRGRKHIFRRMAETIDSDSDIAWFHAASLGEFEQGRPVIEAFREKCPGYKILVTFYSPSGYEIRKDYKGADYIFYLPSDTPRKVRRFMRIVRPKIAVFIKYEYWVNYLLALKKSGTRVYIVSAILRPEQSFFKWYGGLFRRALRCFTHIFVQNGQSRELLAGIGITNVTVAGDTRFDRVAKIAAAAKELPEVARFAAGRQVLVAGSTWPHDEQLLAKLIEEFPQIKFIIAPHEIDGERIEKLMREMSRPALRYTELNPDSDLSKTEVLFIDTIGILSSVYRYGRYGYIGGGFGAGIHNILEAATFGLPLAFGPNYHKFAEAEALIAGGGAVSVDDYEGLGAWLEKLITDKTAYDAAREACTGYVGSHTGATALIIREICR